MSADLPVLVERLWPYVASAVGDHGRLVLSTGPDEAAGCGRELLQRIFGVDPPAEESPVELAELVDRPDDTELQAALRVRIRRVLAADPELVAQVREILVRAEATPGSYVRAGDRGGGGRAGQHRHRPDGRSRSGGQPALPRPGTGAG